MGEPVIVEAARTPIGKRNGWLSGVKAPHLLAAAQFGVLARAGVEPGDVDQLIGGCVTQGGQQASNVTRNAWLSRGVNYTAAATTIDCQCGSGQQANNFMAGLVATGGARIGIACGVEQMSQVPLGTAARGGGGYYKDETWPYPDEAGTQFEAAERIAKMRGLSRTDLDRLGVASQEKAIRARARSPWAAATSESIHSTAAAPSEICDEVPAVWIAPSATGRSLARPSSVDSRSPWSRVTVVVSPVGVKSVSTTGASTGTTSRSKRPSAHARIAFSWEATPRRSRSVRDRPRIFAIRSAASNWVPASSG